mmetsp:Transcript_87054/g.182206  ORF Transcript_87054/g.182206 Transcript_87054/m.182206 type:complete len:226 (+) Transcript_87054:239-916(+)
MDEFEIALLRAAKPCAMGELPRARQQRSSCRATIGIPRVLRRRRGGSTSLSCTPVVEEFQGEVFVWPPIRLCHHPNQLHVLCKGRRFGISLEGRSHHVRSDFQVASQQVCHSQVVHDEEILGIIAQASLKSVQRFVVTLQLHICVAQGVESVRNVLIQFQTMSQLGDCFGIPPQHHQREAVVNIESVQVEPSKPQSVTPENVLQVVNSLLGPTGLQVNLGHAIFG